MAEWRQIQVQSPVDKSAVMKLDKKYRVPLMLFYYEGYSTKEISSFLGIPEKTISARLFRAKAKLKEYLKKE